MAPRCRTAAYWPETGPSAGLHPTEQHFSKDGGADAGAPVAADVSAREEEIMEAERGKEKVVNGIDMKQLFSTIDGIKDQPEIAQFRFRATNQWVGGTHCRATVKDFYGALKEDDSRQAAVFDLDEPQVLLGHSEGTNPVEYLLVALSGCLTTSLVAHASAKGIHVNGVYSRYEGDIDLRGFLGLSETVPVGYQEIRVTFKIDADVTDEEKEEMIRMAQKHSPVFNTITRSAPVTVRLDR
jgi:uncharacterized OsmC-like protein